VAGTAYDSDSWTNHWIVRRSTDGGASWSTVDAFTPGGFTTEADAITVDAAGNVYVVGVADYNTGNSYWTVRKGVGGTAFATVDRASRKVVGSSAPRSPPLLCLCIRPLASSWPASSGSWSTNSEAPLRNGRYVGASMVARPGPQLTLLRLPTRASTQPKPMASALTPSATCTS